MQISVICPFSVLFPVLFPVLFSVSFTVLFFIPLYSACHTPFIHRLPKRLLYATQFRCVSINARWKK